MKLSETQLKTLKVYAPENHPAPEQYINMVNLNVLKTDKHGVLRPIEDLYYFLQVCQRTKLDPTMRQIYAVYRWDSRQGREVMTIQTGIDGLRSIAESGGLYGGSEDAQHEYMVVNPSAPKEALRKSTVSVYKINNISGELMKTTASALWDEYYPGDAMGKMWLKMPHVMLDKCAEALALRKAFPKCAGIYVSEEMDQASPLANLPTPKLKEKNADTN